MGVAGSTSTAAIAVQIDNQGPVYGGGQLSGKVYLSVSNDGYSADTLNLKFYGQESTCVHYRESESYKDIKGQHRTRTVHRTAHDRRPIVVIDLPLANFPGGKVERGNYEFPFILTLPYGLPGKQGIKSGSYFVIEYFLEARLHRPGWLQWDVKNHQEIFLMDPPQATVKTPSFNEPVTRPVYSFCCFNQGNMSLLTNVDGTQIGVGENLKIDYSVYNASTASVMAIEVSLIQSILYSAGRHSEHDWKVLYCHRIQSTEISGTDRVDKNNQKPNLSGLDLFKEMSKHLSHLQFNIPACRSTVAGRLGTVRHFVNVKIITESCVQNPEMSVYLTIYQPSPVIFQGVAPEVGTVFARPVDWQAQTAAVVTLQSNLVNAVPEPASAPPMAQMVTVGGMQTIPIAGASAPTPSAPQSAPGSASDFGSVASLVHMLQTQGNAFTEVFMLKEWLTYGEVAHLVAYPGSLASVFATIRGEYALAAFPEEIGKALPGQICVRHVVEAASAAKTPDARAKICSAFSEFVTDKENAKSGFEALNLPEHMLTLVLIKYGQ